MLSRSERERSWELFTEALESDLSDTQGGTTPEGVHLGAMAGTVDLIQRCYSGLETRGDTLCLSPCLPAELDTIDFSLYYRQRWLNIHLSQDRVTVRSALASGPPITLRCGDRVVQLSPGETADFMSLQAAPRG